MENRDKEEQEKGFTVRDKRFSAKTEEEIPAKAGTEEAPPVRDDKKREEGPGEQGMEEDFPLPEINFTNFILSLSTSALIQMGEILDPATKQPIKRLPLAKQTIDLIAVLREKTKGNLTPDESKVLEAILYDLRMRYIKAAG